MSALRDYPYVPKGSTELTPRQREVLDFITAYLRQSGLPPTLREIADGIGVATPGGALCLLRPLIRKGAVRRVGLHLSRSFVPTVDEGCCPCCGRPFDDVTT